MTTDEDLVALKLKGYNCHIRFTDGEDLYCKVSAPSDENVRSEWLSDIEQKINGMVNEELQWGEAVFPFPEMAIRAEHIKYVRLF